jgi:hypothetical protein
MDKTTEKKDTRQNERNNLTVENWIATIQIEKKKWNHILPKSFSLKLPSTGTFQSFTDGSEKIL